MRFAPFDRHVNRVTGTYRNGKVALDQPVDWPEGTLVVWEYGVQPERVDFCFDGSPWEDTPEANQRWVQWFDSLEPVLTKQELERFESELRSARDEQKALLPESAIEFGRLYAELRRAGRTFQVPDIQIGKLPVLFTDTMP